MPVDYRKWDHIEVSDDEDDTHPNVDTPSLFRWRHQARLDRMAETKREKEEFQQYKSEHSRKINEIRQKLGAMELAEAEKERLKVELSELEKQTEEFKRKEEELAKKERLQPLNVDTLGHEGFSKSRINKIEPLPEPAELDDETRANEMQKFVQENKDLLKEFGMLSKWDDSKQFLLAHPNLCCEETANHLVLQCLDHEVDEKHDLMEHVAHQTIIIQYLLELAKTMKVSPKAPQLISSFFSKLKVADQMYHDAFDDELRAFKERIQNRAKEKIAEAIKDAEEEERKNRLGPGGLDPVEVFETLPKEMQECFEKQDIQSLQDVAARMDPVEFKKHLDRCVASGLWLPDGGKMDGGPEKQTPTDINMDEIGKKDKQDNNETELRQRKSANSTNR